MPTQTQDDSSTAAFKQVMSQMNIADRSAFDQQFEQQWEEASDENELLSVLICEIDFFKEYHENYGQQGASFMILVVALALKNTCEKHGCFLAHYDKEEFAILIKGGDQNAILEIADSLRTAVEDSNTEHKFSKISKIVTLSIGISSLHPNSMQMLMKSTDKALLNAKNSGRNQVSGSLPESEKIQKTDITAPKVDDFSTNESDDSSPSDIYDNLTFEVDEEDIPIPMVNMDDERIQKSEKELTTGTNDAPKKRKNKMFTLDLEDFFMSEKDKELQRKQKQNSAKKTKFKGDIDINGDIF